MSNDQQQRIDKALAIVANGVDDGDHHKMWFIDQMVRALTGCPTVTREATRYPGLRYQAQGESAEYLAWIAEYENGGDGPATYSWDEGIAP